MSASATPPAVPDGVLVQSIVVDDHGEQAGYRIFGDGRYQTLLRDGGWVDGAPLDRARLEAVERALEAAPVDGLAGRYEGAAGDGEPQVLWVQVAQRRAPCGPSPWSVTDACRSSSG